MTKVYAQGKNRYFLLLVAEDGTVVKRFGTKYRDSDIEKSVMERVEKMADKWIAKKKKNLECEKKRKRDRRSIRTVRAEIQDRVGGRKRMQRMCNVRFMP